MITLSSVFACRSYRSRLRERVCLAEKKSVTVTVNRSAEEAQGQSCSDRLMTIFFFLSFFPSFFVFPLVFLLHCSFSLIEIDFTLPHRCHHLTTAAAAVVTVVFTVVVFPSIFFFPFSLSSFLLLLLLCPHGALKLESRLERRKEDR